LAAIGQSGPPVSGFTIRRAGREDIGAITPLFDAYRGFYGREHDFALASRFLSDRLEREECVVFLALAGHEPVGFVQLYPSFDSVEARSVWILHDLFVSPQRRSRGVGRALMEAARRMAEETGACGLSLATATDNRVAQRLYESLGYVRDTRFIHYFLAVTPRDRAGDE